MIEGYSDWRLQWSKATVIEGYSEGYSEGYAKLGKDWTKYIRGQEIDKLSIVILDVSIEERERNPSYPAGIIKPEAGVVATPRISTQAMCLYSHTNPNPN